MCRPSSIVNAKKSTVRQSKKKNRVESYSRTYIPITGLADLRVIGVVFRYPGEPGEDLMMMLAEGCATILEQTIIFLFGFR
jgi:hypothetical protein